MQGIANTNISSLIAQYRLGRNTDKVEKSFQRLASGYRINRAADDASGIQISSILTGQTKSSKQALRNAQDGISVLQIAEGSLQVIGDNLQRMRELTVQAANDSNTQVQRDAMALELRRLAEEIERISTQSNFVGLNLLDGSNSAVGAARIQIGPNANLVTDTLDISSAFASVRIDSNAPSNGIGVIDSAGGTTFATLNDIYDFGTLTSPVLTTSAAAQSFLDDLDAAISQVTMQRASIGAFTNQLESVTENLNDAIVNYEYSNSLIRDLDMASETSALAQNQILQQAAVSILTQANSLPQMSLRLLER